MEGLPDHAKQGYSLCWAKISQPHALINHSLIGIHLIIFLIQKGRHNSHYPSPQTTCSTHLLKGYIYEATDNRALAAESFQVAVQADPLCYEAIHALTQHHMLTAKEGEAWLALEIWLLPLFSYSTSYIKNNKYTIFMYMQRYFSFMISVYSFI